MNNQMSRRTFFFLGLGLMAGRALYSPVIKIFSMNEMNETLLYGIPYYQPTFHGEWMGIPRDYLTHMRLYEIMSKGYIMVDEPDNQQFLLHMEGMNGMNG